tara:strand:+ start:2098 stop:3051 length:954 start_codon:yes stop_codon:yes gene_type:complete
MINSVRNTVLSILNKNNYGYISPSDFNLFATQAQIEIYEDYFSNYNKQIVYENKRISGTDYADMIKPATEVMETFLMSDFIIPKLTAALNLTNNYSYPSLVTVGYESYMVSKVIVYTSTLASNYTDGASAFNLLDSTADFITDGVSVGDIVVNTDTFQSSTVATVTSAVALALNDNIMLLASNYIIYAASSYSEAEKVTNGKILMLASSLLTAPSLIYPAYTNIGSSITLYPTTIQGYGAVKVDSFRYPKAPKWTYVILTGGEPVFDQSQLDYQDFEMAVGDEYRLVAKICQYCGISIRETEVAQFGIAQQAQQDAV